MKGLKKKKKKKLVVIYNPDYDQATAMRLHRVFEFPGLGTLCVKRQQLEL